MDYLACQVPLSDKNDIEKLTVFVMHKLTMHVSLILFSRIYYLLEITYYLLFMYDIICFSRVRNI